MAIVQYTAEELRRKPSLSDSDIEALDKMTEEEIHQAALDDPDAQPLTEEQLKKFKRVVRKGDGTYGHDKTGNQQQAAS